MWCSILPQYREQYRSIIKDCNHVKVLAIISYNGMDREYVVEANWRSCANPNNRNETAKKFIDISIKDNYDSSLYGAHWISSFKIGQAIEDFKTNKQAIKVLSSDY